MKFFMVTAYRFDQQFSEKRRIVHRVATLHNMVPCYAKFQVPMLSGGFDLSGTLDLIRQANFIVADLTYERPSCYYEVGFANGLNKPVHLIAYDSRSSEHIPLCAVLGIENILHYTDLRAYERLLDSVLRLHT